MYQANDYDLEQWLALSAKMRQDKYNTIVKPDFPDIHTIEELVYYGNLSWTLSQRKERWIRASAYINRGNGAQTGSEIARDYLDWKYPRKLRACGAQADSLRSNRFAPLYVRPEILEFAAYVDISATYWSFMALVGWDVDYFPGHWLRAGNPPSDFPLPDVKVARNSLVSAGLPTPMRIWTGKHFINKHRPNIHLNMGLWACIMDVLHAIATKALALGACYVHTDGYILPFYEAAELIGYISQYRLKATIKAFGLAIVNGVGNYRVGDKVTKYFGTPGVLTGGLNSVMRVNDERFIAKFQKIDNRRGKST